MLLFRIGHDNEGGFAGWHLDNVIVNVPALNLKWVFHANRWLDESEGDKLCEVELYPVLKIEGLLLGQSFDGVIK